MNILDQGAENYRRSIPPDPLAQLAGSVGLKVASPEAEQKLRTMGQVVAQEAAKSSQIQQADAVSKAVTQWKQSFFNPPPPPPRK